MRKLILSLVSMGLLSLSSLAYAVDKKPVVQVHMEVYHVLLKANKEKLIPAKEAKPGDVLEYQATYVNKTLSTVKNLQAVMPIPEHMVYEKGSERPAHAWASLDGKKFQAMPLMRKVKQQDGSWKKVAVPLEAYRFLRWDLGALKAKEEKTVSVRVRVNQ